MKKLGLSAVVVLIFFVLFSGCTTGDQTPVQTPQPVVTATQTPVPTQEAHMLTDPILVIGDDIYSTKITIDAKDSGSNSLIVTVKFDSTNKMGSTGPGMDLLNTVFAYNYDDVPASFNPQTREDIIAAGIPYKTMRPTVYPNNIVFSGVDLPGDSVQGSLSIDKPYNYGAIITKEDERN